jgi:branched-chain amino acid aminotransferase
MTDAPRFAWLNGRIVPWDRCVVHARSQGAFWGANVFEGVRGYWRDGQINLFRLDDHLARLGRSMRSLHMAIDYDADQLQEACLELIQANEFREHVHLCIVPFFDLAPGFDPLRHTEATGVHITAVPMPRSPGYAKGVSACVSSWRRISDDTMPPRIKTGANYHNSRLAQHEAVRNGFDVTLILNQRGHLAESAGACVVLVRDGQLITPPGTSGVLEGITVATVADIAREQGLTLTRREVDRTELYVADEVFLCGTLAELLPVTSVDRLLVGDGAPGELTRTLQRHYETAVHGRSDWTTPVYAPRRAA